jgi:plastocyanin
MIFASSPRAMRIRVVFPLLLAVVLSLSACKFSFSSPKSGTGGATSSADSVRNELEVGTTLEEGQAAVLDDGSSSVDVGQTEAVNGGGDTPTSEGGTPGTADAQTEETTPSSSSEEVSNRNVIKISAKNWAFNPTSITVKQGEDVLLEITSIEGDHGFAVPDLKISVPLPEGEVVRVKLPTTTVGTFSFICSIPCGEGHKGMVGTITVEE